MIKIRNMKKIITAFFIMAGSYLLQAQVGVNTQTPKATFDVVAKKTDGTTAEGVIAPRLTGDQIIAAEAHYGADQTGAIVYATAPVTTPTPWSKLECCGPCHSWTWGCASCASPDQSQPTWNPAAPSCGNRTTASAARCA